MSDKTPFLRNAKVEAKDQRFLALLASALARIPQGTPSLLTVRRVDLKRRGEMRGLVGLTSWGERPAWRDGGEIRGANGGGSQTISFYTELLNQLSEEASIGVIAHELAHAWLNEHVSPENSVTREGEADELARRWGFGKELDALDLETEPV